MRLDSKYPAASGRFPTPNSDNLFCRHPCGNLTSIGRAATLFCGHPFVSEKNVPFIFKKNFLFTVNCQTLLITKTVLVGCFGNRIRERNQDLDRQKSTVFLSPVTNPSVTSWRCLFFSPCDRPFAYVRPCFWRLREKFTENQISLLALSSLSHLGHKRNRFNNPQHLSPSLP